MTMSRIVNTSHVFVGLTRVCLGPFLLPPVMVSAALSSIGRSPEWAIAAGRGRLAERSARPLEVDDRGDAPVDSYRVVGCAS